MRLAIFATHPIQYQVPLWRLLAQSSGLEVAVFYFSDQSVCGGVDHGFGVPVKWDTELLGGYRSEFITRNANLAKPNSVRIPCVAELLREGGFDWVLLQGYTHCFERQVLRTAKRLGIKIVMRGEFADVRRDRSCLKSILRDLYLKWFYSHVDSFCYVGQEARRHLLARRITDEKLHFSPYTVDTALFEAQRASYDRESSRAMLGLNESTFAFIFSGKLIPRKESLLLLDAIGCLPSLEDVAIIMLGDGPLRTSVLERGREVLGSRFLFQGFVNQSKLGQYYLAADAFVLPSECETWGLVVNEAMQFSLPVITSDGVGCNKDLVIEGKTGFVFPRGNRTALEIVLRRVQSDPLRARKMGQNARDHILLYSTAAS
ncbi:MAG TPA: glycosyltransferase family 4 protein, partial [Desulfosporosinus sp.]|nr:glycosyltransferase family 4 protein [Desulfosporosinus sp.]